MYCSSCGSALAAEARLCSHCGQPVAGTYAPPLPQARPGLARPRAGRQIAGVCQGIANTYGWDVTVVRVVFVLLALLTGIGLVAYAVIWVVAPDEPLAVSSGPLYTPPR